MGVVGAAIKGFGKALKVGKKAKLKTVYRPRKGLYIEQFKKSKKHGLGKKISVEMERETGKLLSQAGSGVNIKYTKTGKPYVPEGTKSSILTKSKGITKLVAPVAAAATAGTIHGAIEAKKKKKKK